jgi:hypothetical protein
MFPIRAALGIFVATAALMLNGCAVVRIQTPGSDAAEVKRGFGIVSVVVKPNADATVVESTTFGAIHGLEGFSIGYHEATWAAFKDNSCHVVLWIDTNEQLDQLNEFLHGRTDVCVVRPQN